MSAATYVFVCGASMCVHVCICINGTIIKFEEKNRYGLFKIACDGWIERILCLRETLMCSLVACRCCCFFTSSSSSFSTSLFFSFGLAHTAVRACVCVRVHVYLFRLTHFFLSAFLYMLLWHIWWDYDNTQANFKHAPEYLNALFATVITLRIQYAHFSHSFSMVFVSGCLFVHCLLILDS